MLFPDLKIAKNKILEHNVLDCKFTVNTVLWQFLVRFADIASFEIKVSI